MSKRTIFPALSSGAWWLLGLAAIAMVLLWWGGDKVQLALRYERAAIFDGELWRLFTGHLVHFDFRHLVLNLAGGGLMVLLFGELFTVRQWLCVLAASTVAIDVGFVWLMPNLVWYVGLSGVLHGVLAAGAIAWWRIESPSMAAALSAIVIGKLAWEQFQGALPMAGEMPVVVNAHLYGAIGGGLCGMVLIWLSRHHKQSIAPL